MSRVIKRTLHATIAVSVCVVIFQLLDLDDQSWYAVQDLRTSAGKRQGSVWLPRYGADVQAVTIAGIEENVSGITWDHDSGSLWIVVNHPPVLVELGPDLAPLRQIVLGGFNDTEAVAYAGDGILAIADERRQDIVLAPVGPQTTQLVKRELRRLTINLDGNDNKGLEGVAVDPVKHDIYTVRERDPMKLMVLSGFLDETHAICVEEPVNIEVNRLYVSDLSGLHFDADTQHLLILSDEAKLLVEVGLDGERISYMDLEAGFSGLSDSIPQAEGVTLDGERNLYIVSEPNLIYRFTPRQPAP